MAKETVMKGLIHALDYDGLQKPIFPATTADMVFTDVENGLTLKDVINTEINDNTVIHNAVFFETSTTGVDIGAMKIDLPFTTSDDVGVNIELSTVGANHETSSNLYDTNEGSVFDMGGVATSNIYEMSNDGRYLFTSISTTSANALIGEKYKLYSIFVSRLLPVDIKFKFIDTPRQAKFSKDSRYLIVEGLNVSTSYIEIYDVSGDTPILRAAHKNKLTTASYSIANFDTLELPDTNGALVHAIAVIPGANNYVSAVNFFRYDIEENVHYVGSDGIASGTVCKFIIATDSGFETVMFTTTIALYKGDMIATDGTSVWAYGSTYSTFTVDSTLDESDALYLDTEISYPLKSYTGVAMGAGFSATDFASITKCLVSPDSSRIVLVDTGDVYPATLMTDPTTNAHVYRYNTDFDNIAKNRYGANITAGDRIISLKYSSANELMMLTSYTQGSVMYALTHLAIGSRGVSVAITVPDIKTKYGLSTFSTLTNFDTVPTTSAYSTATNKDVVLVGYASNYNPIVRIANPFSETTGSGSTYTKYESYSNGSYDGEFGDVHVHPTNGHAFCSIRNVSGYSTIPYMISSGNPTIRFTQNPQYSAFPKSDIMHVSNNGEFVVCGNRGGSIPNIYAKSSGTYRTIQITLHTNVNGSDPNGTNSLTDAMFVDDGKWLILAHNSSYQCRLTAYYYNGTSYVPIGSTNPTTGSGIKMYMSGSRVESGTTYVLVALTLSGGTNMFRLDLTTSTFGYSMNFNGNILPSADKIIFNTAGSRFLFIRRGNLGSSVYNVIAYTMDMRTGTSSSNYSKVCDISLPSTVASTMISGMSAATNDCSILYIATRDSSSNINFIHSTTINWTSATFVNVGYNNNSVVNKQITAMAMDNANNSLYVADATNGLRRYSINTSTTKLTTISTDTSLRDMSMPLNVSLSGTVLIGARTRYPYSALLSSLSNFISGKIYITGHLSDGIWTERTISTTNDAFDGIVKLGYDNAVNKAVVTIGDGDSTWVGGGVIINSIAITGQHLTATSYKTGYDMSFVNNNRLSTILYSGDAYIPDTSGFVDRSRIANLMVYPIDWVSDLSASGYYIARIYHDNIKSTSNVVISMADPDSNHLAVDAGMAAMVNEYSGYCVIYSTRVPTGTITVNVDILN